VCRSRCVCVCVCVCVIRQGIIIAQVVLSPPTYTSKQIHQFLLCVLFALRFLLEWLVWIRTCCVIWDRSVLFLLSLWTHICLRSGAMRIMFSQKLFLKPQWICCLQHCLRLALSTAFLTWLIKTNLKLCIGLFLSLKYFKKYFFYCLKYFHN